MDGATAVGVTASFFTTLSLVPQLLKLYKEKKAQNISMGMLSVLLAGLVFWILYGVLQEDWIIIVSNALSLLINVTTIVLARRYTQVPSASAKVQKNGNRLRMHDP